MADGLLNKASIILTPTGYKAGTLYNVAPVVEPYEDFDFARASVASRVNSSGLVEMVGRTLGSELVQNGDFSELGSELITNGDFSDGTNDWGGNATLSIDNGRLKLSGTSGQTAEQTITATVGKTYKVSYDLTLGTATSGAIIITGGNYPTLDASEGSNTFYSTATSTTFRVRPRLGSNGTIFVDNVSVKQVDPNDYWTKTQSGNDTIVIENGYALFNCPDNSNIFISQSSVMTIGKTYTASFDIISIDSGGFLFGNGGGGTISGSPTANTVGTHTFTFVATTASFVIKRALGSPNLLNGKIDNVSVKEVIDTNNIPRISYDSNGDNGHILLEPTSTNLIKYSEDFQNSYWNTVNRVTIETTSITSPNGSNNTYKLFANTVSNSHYLDNINYGGALSGQTYTYSIFVKSAGSDFIQLASSTGFPGRYQNFNLSTGTKASGDISNATIEAYPNGWYRISVTETTNSTSRRFLIVPVLTDNSRNPVFVGNAQEDGVYIFGAQLEELSYATSYIPTLTGSTVTRATETANGAGSADLINSTEGVLYAEIAALTDDLSNKFISLTDGSTSNSVTIFYGGVSDRIRAEIKSGNTTQADMFISSYDITNTNKIAVKYKADDFALWINGTEVRTDTSGSTPIGLNDLSFNRAGGSPFYGKCKALAVFNEALSDSELTQLTT